MVSHSVVVLRLTSLNSRAKATIQATGILTCIQRCSLAQRIFELVEDEALTQFTFARDVRFIDLGLSDLMSAAQSPSRVVDLASHELTLLIKQWEELARGGGVTLWGIASPRHRRRGCVRRSTGRCGHRCRCRRRCDRPPEQFGRAS